MACLVEASKKRCERVAELSNRLTAAKQVPQRKAQEGKRQKENEGERGGNDPALRSV